MAITTLGLSGNEIKKRLTAVKDAWDRAQGKLTMDAIVAHTMQGMLGMLAGAIAMVVGAALVILIGNVGGSVIGGVIGGFTTGGAGSVPGAMAGRMVGNAVAVAFLELLGVGLLITFIAGEIAGIGRHFYDAVDCAWNSADMGGELYEMRMNYSARHFAEGVGKFFGALVMALVVVLTRGKAEEKARVANSKLMKICDGLQNHIGRNLSVLEGKYKGGLAKATVTKGLPETPEGLVSARATAKAFKPFEDMPSFKWMKVSALRAWMKANRFVKVAEMKKPGQYLQDGTKTPDYKSEVWMRQRTPGGEIETVRIDPKGHQIQRHRDGPLRLPTKGGKTTAEQIAWGERPHYHMDTVKPAQATEYTQKYVQVPTYAENGRLSVEVANESQLASVVAHLFGPGFGHSMGKSNFEVMHIPLMP